MAYYAGLDVSLEQTSVCVVDKAGAVVLERRVATEPAAIATALAALPEAPARVLLETGGLTPWAVARARRAWPGGARHRRTPRQACPRAGAAGPGGRSWRCGRPRRIATTPVAWPRSRAWGGTPTFG